MTGVTLRSTWITWAMFMGPWSGARPPIREAITKNVYISPESGSLIAGKNTQSVVYYYKKEKGLFLDIPSCHGLIKNLLACRFCQEADNNHCDESNDKCIEGKMHR